MIKAGNLDDTPERITRKLGGGTWTRIPSASGDGSPAPRLSRVDSLTVLHSPLQQGQPAIELQASASPGPKPFASPARPASREHSFHLPPKPPSSSWQQALKAPRLPDSTRTASASPLVDSGQAASSRPTTTAAFPAGAAQQQLAAPPGEQAVEASPSVTHFQTISLDSPEARSPSFVESTARPQGTFTTWLSSTFPRPSWSGRKQSHSDDHQEDAQEEAFGMSPVRASADGDKSFHQYKLSPDHNPLVPLRSPSRPPYHGAAARNHIDEDAALQMQVAADRRLAKHVIKLQAQEEQLNALKAQVEQLQAEKSRQVELEREATSGTSFSSSHKEVQASVESEASEQVEQLTKENEQLMTLVRKQDGFVGQMQQMLEARSAEMVQLHQDAAATLPRLTDAVEAASEWQAKYTECAERLQGVQGTCKSQHGQLANLQRQLSLQQKATETLQEQLDQRKAELEELQRESRSSSQAQMEASKALAAAARAEQEHQLRQEKQAETEAQLQEAHGKYDKLLAQSRHHARDLEEKLQEAGQVAGLAADHERTISRLDTQLQDEQRRHAAARQARQHLEAELAVRAPRGELQALQNQNQQLQEEVSNLHAALKAADEKIERLQKRAKQAEAELRQHQAAASSAERHSGPATAHGSATSSQGVPSPPNTLGQGWDPEEVVQKLLAALVDQENRSRQWADERQQLQETARAARQEVGQRDRLLAETRAELDSAKNTPRDKQPVEGARMQGRQQANHVLESKLARLESDWRKSQQAAAADRQHVNHAHKEELVVREETLGKENRAMQRRLEHVEMELGRVQRQRDSHLLHCRSLQHRLATLQDVALLSHGKAAVSQLAVVGNHIRAHPR